MEVNGVANIKILVDQLEEEAGHDMELMPDFVTEVTYQIQEQLLLLERYMLAYADHKASITAGHYGDLTFTTPEPLWHEVRENPEKYPTGQERINGMKKQMENRK
jgi:hypothetical protein